ncbi:MAG TPA: hypothetical protein VMF89_07705 [Polyangiales bacterium]|nr:hypothetical protein [Polyangiales bacterium]
MNRYGRIAHKHWMEHLPSRFGAIKDPEAFFTTLGEQIEERVDELSQAIAGDDPVGESYLEKVGRLNEAKQSAEATALQEIALLAPEAQP